MQFHVWGADLPQALEHVAQCLFNFITDLSLIEEKDEMEFEVSGEYLSTYCLPIASFA